MVVDLPAILLLSDYCYELFILNLNNDDVSIILILYGPFYVYSWIEQK